jgi:hypothetical protein
MDRIYQMRTDVSKYTFSDLLTNPSRFHFTLNWVFVIRKEDMQAFSELFESWIVWQVKLFRFTWRWLMMYWTLAFISVRNLRRMDSTGTTDTLELMKDRLKIPTFKVDTFLNWSGHVSELHQVGNQFFLWNNFYIVWFRVILVFGSGIVYALFLVSM